jgi:hypothetical protein
MISGELGWKNKNPVGLKDTIFCLALQCLAGAF